MTERNLRANAAGGTGTGDWTNHYSPKYNRFFIAAIYLEDPKTVKGGPFFRTSLIDAFERSQIAASAGECRLKQYVVMTKSPKIAKPSRPLFGRRLV